MKCDDSHSTTRLLLDTSAVIDPPDRTELSLDSEGTVSSITLAELLAGVHAGRQDQAAGRNPRPRRMDLLIAAVAAANRVPLVTRNGSDFAELREMLQVIALPGRPTPMPA